MRQALWSTVALAALCFSSLLVACGDDDDDDGKSCNGLNVTDHGSAECIACTEDSCSSEYSAYCSAGCTPDSTTSACQQASGDVISCVLSKCAAQCVTISGVPSPGDTEKNFTCYQAAEGICSASLSSEGVEEMLDGSCTEAGGTSGDKCPSEGLIGCCELVSSKTCVYTTSGSPLTADSCAQIGGLWSTTP